MAFHDFGSKFDLQPKEAGFEHTAHADITSRSSLAVYYTLPSPPLLPFSPSPLPTGGTTQHW